MGRCQSARSWLFAPAFVAVAAGIGLVSLPLCIPLEAVLFVCVWALWLSSYTGKYWKGPVGLYLILVITCIFREGFLIFYSEVPCGLCPYVSKCASYDGDFDVIGASETVGVSSLAARAVQKEGARTKSSGGRQGHTANRSVGSVINFGFRDGSETDAELLYASTGHCTSWNATLNGKCIDKMDRMDFSLVWIAAVPVLFTIGVVVWHMRALLTEPELISWSLAPLCVILMLPLTFSVSALHSMRLLSMVNDTDLWTPTAILDVCELYTAVALLAFKQLILSCANSTKDQLQDLHCASFDNLWSLGGNLMELGCIPYVYVCFFCNFIEIFKEIMNFWWPEACMKHVMEVYAFFFPSLYAVFKPPAKFEAFRDQQGSYACEAVWGAFKPTLTLMSFLVCHLAVACLCRYELYVGRMLHTVNASMKFYGVKCLLLIGFWQACLRSILLSWYPDDAAWKMEMYGMVLCWEALAFSIYQLLVYRPNDFASIGSEPVVMYHSQALSEVAWDFVSSPPLPWDSRNSEGGANRNSQSGSKESSRGVGHRSSSKDMRGPPKDLRGLSRRGDVSGHDDHYEALAGNDGSQEPQSHRPECNCTIS